MTPGKPLTLDVITDNAPDKSSVFGRMVII